MEIGPRDENFRRRENTLKRTFCRHFYSRFWHVQMRVHAYIGTCVHHHVARGFSSSVRRVRRNKRAFLTTKHANKEDVTVKGCNC